MAETVHVTFFGAALKELLQGSSGPVARDLLRRGTLVQEEARRLVGKRTRRLEASIIKRLVKDARGLACYIGSDVPYAYAHHEGTPAHVIVPVNARVLVFTVGGTTVFTRRVNHPGTRPNRYLVNALPAARG